MNHLNRGPFQNMNWKCIHVTKMVQNIDNHNNIGCVRPGKCLKQRVKTKDGYFLHYRIGWKVSDQCEDGKCVKYDPIALKYKTKLENNMKYVLGKIFPRK